MSYAEAGAFVRYLVEGYGQQKLLEAYGRLKSSDSREVHKKLKEIYEVSLAELEHAWQASFAAC